MGKVEVEVATTPRAPWLAPLERLEPFWTLLYFSWNCLGHYWALIHGTLCFFPIFSLLSPCFPINQTLGKSGGGGGGGWLLSQFADCSNRTLRSLRKCIKVHIADTCMSLFSLSFELRFDGNVSRKLWLGYYSQKGGGGGGGYYGQGGGLWNSSEMRPLWHVLVNSTCTLSHLVTVPCSCEVVVVTTHREAMEVEVVATMHKEVVEEAQTVWQYNKKNEERFVLQCLARIQAAQTASSTTKQWDNGPHSGSKATGC